MIKLGKDNGTLRVSILAFLTVSQVYICFKAVKPAGELEQTLNHLLTFIILAASCKLNILMVGPRRTGKSSAGNTMLQKGQVFETRGGGASTAASAITAGRHVTVVDAQGWGLSEEFVPHQEKTELLRALSLCRPEGPHVVLLVIPLLDFTEPERRAVERRMEIFTSTVWRHTMVLFTCGDRLRGRECSVEEHIRSGGSALHWLMEKCRYRYHVFDNKAAATGKQESGEQEVKRGGKKQEGAWQKMNDKMGRRKSRGGEADGRKEGEQKQVRELLSKVEDMLQENGGWHFSLHMYQRLEEEWSRREQELRARLEAEVEAKTEETKINMEPEEEQRRMSRGEEKEEEGEIELKTLSSEGWDGWDTSSDSGGEKEESTEVKTSLMAPCWPNGGQLDISVRLLHRDNCTYSEDAEQRNIFGSLFYRHTGKHNLALFKVCNKSRKLCTQYGLRRLTRQMEGSTEDNMVATPGPSQKDTGAEITAIKALLQGITSDMSGLKSGMDAVQTAVDKLGARVTEAETQISALEDHGQNLDVAVGTAAKTIAQLQEKVTYFEDAGCRNNVRIVGIEEGAKDRDMQIQSNDWSTNSPKRTSQL
ncbi:hypothetical protein L3Q82_006205 [Scortum barcoo]|uniref:Uncharacterized protein n=1 Tax=Scortum barcoo TaxID=214431 RepID=A0ACB8X3B4_9TELE|nr:hypothetical protein L3Q82_006205 [Scortum barcoo]